MTSHPSAMMTEMGVQHWTCLGCGAACTRPTVRGQRPKWCDECRTRGRRERSCAACGAIGVRGDGIYCSTLCAPRNAFDRRSRAKAKLTLAARGTVGRTWTHGPCRICGTPTTWKSHRDAACSPRCSRRIKALARKGRHRIRRVEVFARDGYSCWLCDKPTDATAKVPHPLAPTIDHVLPRSHGGSDDPANLRCAHFICNSRRGDAIAA